MSENKYFQKFLERWALTNPRPDKAKHFDMFALRVLQIAIIGSVALSGTRTGTMIGETAMFSKFIQALGFADWLIPYINLVEGIFGLATFEASIFVAGYIFSDRLNKNNNPVFYYVFIGAAIAPALVANLAPAAQIVGPSFFHSWLVFVNVVVGFCTIVLAFLGGLVLKMVKLNFSAKFEEAYEEWQSRQKRAWERSPEYREMRAELNRPSNKQTKKQPITTEFVIEYINTNGPISLSGLVKGTPYTSTELKPVCSELVHNGVLKVVNKKLVVIGGA